MWAIEQFKVLREWLYFILQAQLSYSCHIHFALSFSIKSSLLYMSLYVTLNFAHVLPFPEYASPFFLVPHIRTSKSVLHFSDSSLDNIVSFPYQGRIDYILFWTTTMQQFRFYFGSCKTLSTDNLTNLSPHLKHDYLLPCC